MGRTKTENTGTAPGSETISITTKSDSFEEWLKNPEVIEFIKIGEMVGTLKKPFAEFDLMEQKQFQTSFKQWEKAGKPKPTMPEIKAEQIAAPVCLFKVKQQGKTMMFCDKSDGTTEGIEKQGGKVIKYTIPFDEEKAKTWLKEQEELNPPSQHTSCYIKTDGQTYIIHASDYLKDFDEIAEAIKSGKYVF